MDVLGQAAGILERCGSIVCLSGAGISQASGIPTYQDRLPAPWSEFDPRELETAESFRENPPLIWTWYLWRRRMVSLAQPNAAHLVFPAFASTGRKVSIITQNIDDLHERAGSSSVLHLHGSLGTPKCFACHRPAQLEPDQLQISEEGELIAPPRCQRCRGKLRPGVVWYGEALSSGAWKAAVSLVKNCDVVISVGTSGFVTPAAELPDIALAAGTTVIHVNRVNVSTGKPNELMLLGQASEVLPILLPSEEQAR